MKKFLAGIAVVFLIPIVLAFVALIWFGSEKNTLVSYSEAVNASWGLRH